MGKIGKPEPYFEDFLFLRVTEVDVLGLGWKLVILFAPFRSQILPSSSVHPGETRVFEGRWTPVQQRPRKVGLDPNALCQPLHHLLLCLGRLDSERRHFESMK